MTRLLPKMSASRGMALIAVLWVVATLSISLLGLLRGVRSEIQMVTTSRTTTEGGAVADAAIVLALQQLHAEKRTRWRTKAVLSADFRGQRLDVEVLPANGWIDVNEAPAPLLTALFQHLGRRDPQEAQQLANAIVEFRQKAGDRGLTRAFDGPEDLLSVPGINFDAYASIEKAVIATGGLGSGGRVNPMAGVPDVLLVLLAGDALKVQQLLQQLAVDPASPDVSSISPEMGAAQETSVVFLVSRAGEAERRWLVDLASDSGALPWTVLSRSGSLRPVLVSSPQQ